MIKISTQGISLIESSASAITLTKPVSPHKWKIELYHNSGGLKKAWVIGQGNCPLKKVQFELNLKICGAGSIEFAYLDFPIHANDYVKIYYNGILRYRGQIDNGIDLKGGKVKLIPFSSNFEKHFINNSFTAKTVEEMFETVILAKQDKAKVYWNSFYIDTGSTETFSPNFAAYENMKKIFDDYIKKCEDREHGGLPNGYFTVYKMQETVTKNIFAHFEKCEESKEFSNVKATRLLVYRKNSVTNTTLFCGAVGNDAVGGTYPTLFDIEQKLGGESWAKYTVSDVVATDAEALDIAYSYLLSIAVEPRSVSISNLSLDEYFPVIGEKIKVLDTTAQVLRTIISCDTLEGWSGGTLDTDYYVYGSASLKFGYGSTLESAIIFDFGKTQRFHHPEKIGFMLRASCAGQYLGFSFGKTLEGYSRGTYSSGDYSEDTVDADYLNNYKDIRVNTGSVWEWKEFSLLNGGVNYTDFRYFIIHFSGVPSVSPCYAWINQISLWLYDKSTYEGNVVQAKFTIDKKGNDACNCTLDKYSLQANDRWFKNERKIEQLESIANSG